jgi:hypothetical protein
VRLSIRTRRANTLPPEFRKRAAACCEKIAIVVIYVQFETVRDDNLMEITRPMKAVFGGLAGAAMLAAAGCGGFGPTTPTPSTATPYTYIFNGTLNPGSSMLFTPVLSEASDVSITLVSVTPAGGTTALQTRLGLGYGAPDENDPANTCVLSSQTTTTPGLVAQFKFQSTAVAHCMTVFDAGGLPGAVDFAVRFVITPVSYKVPTPRSTAGTDTFSSLLPVGSSASRAFDVSQPGTIAVTLSVASPPANVTIGLALGVPRADGSGCYVNTTLLTPAGAAPQITRAVEPGEYCVRVFDPGTLGTTVGFTTTAVHP